MEIRKLAVETGAKCFTRAFLGEFPPALLGLGRVTYPNHNANMGTIVRNSKFLGTFVLNKFS